MTAEVKTDHLGKYRLDGIIGKGAMGVVYKAFDEDIERPVAVKVLHSHLLDDDMAEELAYVSVWKPRRRPAACITIS